MPTKISASDLIQLALNSNDQLIQSKRSKSRTNTSIPISSDNGSSVAQAPVDGNSAQRLVQSMAAGEFGWGQNEWNSLYDLINKESGWNPNARNPSSSAAGLFQFLDSTRRNYGITTDSPLEAQVRAGLQYIRDRYQTPSGALRHWQSRVPINGKDVGHWY